MPFKHIRFKHYTAYSTEPPSVIVKPPIEPPIEPLIEGDYVAEIYERIGIFYSPKYDRYYYRYVKDGVEVRSIMYITKDQAKEAIDKLLGIDITPPPPPPFLGGQWVGFAKDGSSSLTEWKTALAKAAKWRFNTVRIPIRFSTLDLAHLDEVLDLTKNVGYKAILDYHVLSSWAGFGPLFGSQGCRNTWLQLAEKFKGDSRIIAFELANEPTTATLDPALKSTDMNVQGLNIITEYARLTDLVRTVDPSRTCVWIDYWNEVDPTPFYKNNVVVTHHPYAYVPDSNTATVPAIIKKRFDEVKHRTRGLFPVWTGEIESIAGNVVWQKVYTSEVIKASLLEGWGFNYWHYWQPLDDGGNDPDLVIALSGYKG